MVISKLQVEKYIADTLPHVKPIDCWGERAFFINPDGLLKRGVYFATIKEKDGENDSSSNLNRHHMFRLNIGIPSENYISIFGAKPKRPSKGCVIDGHYNFSETNIIMPHPIYGWMGWISVLNPKEELFEACKIHLKDAYRYSYKKALKKI